MPNLTTTKEVRYLNKDFTEFRENLIDFAKNYFQDTYNDFDPSDPATMFIDMVSYVGDVLSYYMDSQIKEMLLLHAEERKNVIQLAQALGYKPKPTVPSKTRLDIYQIVPSIGSGENIKPDFRYGLDIKKGMQVSSDQNSNVIFRTLDNVDFTISSSNNPTEVSLYSVDLGEPAYYLLKKQTVVESGTQKEITFDFTDPVKYNKVLITDTNVISIDSVIDSDGNTWYEVPYLAQDTIFKEIKNSSTNNPDLNQYNSQVPYLLKLIKVPKRFITRYRSDGSIEMQFGSGVVNNYDEEITPNSDNVGLQIPTGVSKLNYAWNIANFMYSDTYGQAPSNTTLTVKYSVGGGVKSNVLVNTLNNVYEAQFENLDSDLDSSVVTTVKNSLRTNNPEAATGGRDPESIEEIRHNTLAYFAAQDRAVTRDDYITRVYSMPQKFGSIAKAYITTDEQLSLTQKNEKILNPMALNLYVLTYDSQKKLTQANKAIKENLATYIDRYRMITDSINIKDAFIINIGVDFEITVLPNYNSKEVLLVCIDKLKKYFDIDKWQINQPIVLADIITQIANVKGVQSVIDVTIKNLFDTDSGYNPNVYDIDTATKSGVLYPSLDPSIFEVKYLNDDLRGKVNSY